MKVLVADDDPVACGLLDNWLRQWGYEVVVVNNGEEAWEQLTKEPPSLALLDWVMPKIDGLELCRKIRELRQEPYVYVLIITAKDRKEDVVTGLEAGADDYITKPFNPQELRVRLRAGERILELQSDLITAREELRHQATHDPLTGLWNRASILEILRRELARARRDRTPLGLIMADLDRFKRVNDRHGHMSGDTVLREVSRRLEASVRIYDSVGRYGGEEFLVVLPGCESVGLVALAERLRASIAESGVEAGATNLLVTCSLGAVSGFPAKGSTFETLLGAADAALYKAKKSGRNRVELADPEDAMPPAP